MTGHPTAAASWIPVAIVVLSGCLLAVLLWPAIDAFVADDDDSWLAWCSQPLSRVVQTAGAPHYTSRPAFALFMAIEQRVFGDWLAGYRIVALAVHVLASLALLILSRPWLRPSRGALVALLFLVMPVHHDTLFWIAGRGDLLSGFAVLASMAAFQAGREEERRGRRALAGILIAALALLAALLKETGLIVVPLIVSLAVVFPRQGRRPGRDLPLALLSTAPAFFSLFLYLTRAANTLRLEHAVGSFHKRVTWIVPALGELLWPFSLDEAKTQALWHLGVWGKLVALALAVLGVAVLAWWARREVRRPGVLFGVLLLAVGLVPFFLLPQPRLLYLASAGFAFLLVALARTRWALGLVAFLLVAWSVGLWQQARLWREVTDVGRHAWMQLSLVPEDRILLVDFPLDVGGVLGSAAGVARVPGGKLIEYLAPLRVPRSSGWSPSTIAVEDAHLVVHRPVRWGDHLNYPCDVARMQRRIAEIAMTECRGDASEAVTVPLRKLEGVALYRYDAGTFRPIVVPPSNP